ncbi:sulfite exporter TauE/SafE family protein [Paludibacterium sp.]|uniref:sulfite exporter TauE/SafE family protein n=2 Tax=Paludibacterium sp. TaxID=1917523 RepID=UPI0025ED483C|nr:sulfite exporter TauE/SafE family protein [Paludibacterium sp.]MBV8649080.1 sulfite exporter TauE/SafE family protein [Paludibacterium sp.]
MNVATLPWSTLALIALAGLYAGTQNVLAGGGSFITFPALLLAGLNPLAANMTSTIALFPSQITSAVAGRRLVEGVGPLRFRTLFLLSLAGGVLGAWLLLSTPVSVFTHLVPWLVLFATTVFFWGSFLRKSGQQQVTSMPSGALMAIQGVIALYGGYFGGGIGILMLAALTVAGQQVRTATATKNALAMTMNASAVAIFAFSPQINWLAALALAVGGIGGGVLGAWLMHRLPEKWLRGFVVLVGVVLSVWLFAR